MHASLTRLKLYLEWGYFLQYNFTIMTAKCQFVVENATLGLYSAIYWRTKHAQTCFLKIRNLFPFLVFYAFCCDTLIQNI